MSKLVAEPCTLVYTLLNPDLISFDDFELIIRGLHSYQVDSITPNRENNNVHVRLNYQASIANATAKLGGLQSAVVVSKLSAFVKENEFSRLEILRKQFGFGMPETGDAGAYSHGGQQRRRTRGRGAAGARTFNTRPAPYPVPKPSTSVHSAYYDPENDNTYTLDGTTEEI